MSERKVGCERVDGTLNVHSESEACEVCAEVPRAGEVGPKTLIAHGPKESCEIVGPHHWSECGAYPARPAVPGDGLGFYDVINAAVREVQAWWPDDEEITPTTVLVSLSIFEAELRKRRALSGAEEAR